MKFRIGWLSTTIFVLLAAVLGGLPLAVGVLLVCLFLLFDAKRKEKLVAGQQPVTASDTDQRADSDQTLGIDTANYAEASSGLVSTPDTIQFSYRDAKGDITQRMVEITVAEAETFTGYCHKRRALRTFRYDRVVGDILDMDTGELLTPAAWRHNMKA